MKRSGPGLSRSRWRISIALLLLLIVVSAVFTFRRDQTPAAPRILPPVMNQGRATFPIEKLGRGDIKLMNYSVQVNSPEGWEELRNHGLREHPRLQQRESYSITVDCPTNNLAWRLHIQYGLRTQGPPLWREGVRMAWKTGQWRAIFMLEEWEACDALSDPFAPCQPSPN